MPNVVFVVPFPLENTLRFVRAALQQPGVRLAILTQDAPERIPADLRAQVVLVHRVDDALDTGQLLAGVQHLQRVLGSCDRLLGILEPLQVPLAEVRERLRIRGMDGKEARNFRDKSQMKDVLRAHGLPCARHRLCASAAEALAFAADSGYPVVVKPPAGAGAKATARCADRGELQACVQGMSPGPGREVLVEEFVQGREFSFDSVTVAGQHLFHNVSAYHPTPLTVMENPWIQWCVVLPRDIATPEYAPIHDIGPRALTALGMWTGISHMEWFRRPDGSIAIGEVAARPPGAQFMSLMGHAHDTDFYRAWAQLMVDETFVRPRRRYAAGAAYLRGQGEGKIQAVHGLAALQQLQGVVVESRLPQPGQAAAGTYEGEGYILVRHEQTEVVEQALQTIVTRLRVELG